MPRKNYCRLYHKQLRQLNLLKTERCKHRMFAAYKSNNYHENNTNQMRIGYETVSDSRQGISTCMRNETLLRTTTL